MAETTLRQIEWNTSRTGLMNPVAVFDPVELEGSTVSRASLHNVSILKELKLSIGDTIKVYKANMIIPQIAENLTGTVSRRKFPSIALSAARKRKSVSCATAKRFTALTRTVPHSGYRHLAILFPEMP